MTKEGKGLFEMAADALSAMPDELVSEDRVMCLLYVIRYRFYCRNAYAGLGAAEQAVSLADRLGDQVLRAKAWKMLGVVHLETGNCPDAVSTFTSALAAARAAGEPVQEVEILSNLGVVHQYAGRPFPATSARSKSPRQTPFRRCRARLS